MPCSLRISWIEYETGQFRRAIVARRHPRPWQAFPDDPGQVFVRHGPPEAAAQHRDARHLVAAVAVARRAPRAEQQRPALHISRIVFADVHLRRRQGGITAPNSTTRANRNATVVRGNVATLYEPPQGRLSRGPLPHPDN